MFCIEEMQKNTRRVIIPMFPALEQPIYKARHWLVSIMSILYDTSHRNECFMMAADDQFTAARHASYVHALKAVHSTCTYRSQGESVHLTSI
jgi:hypothetical protein